MTAQLQREIDRLVAEKRSMQGEMDRLRAVVNGRDDLLRDLFAGGALIGMVAHYGANGGSGAAQYAFEYADAMMVARKKEEKARAD